MMSELANSSASLCSPFIHNMYLFLVCRRAKKVARHPLLVVVW